MAATRVMTKNIFMTIKPKPIEIPKRTKYQEFVIKFIGLIRALKQVLL